jgi:mono/diheme cytochrome c family protein
MRGRALFGRHCSNCHTLYASRAVARVGPSLDFLRPPATLVRQTIHDGSSAASASMPPQILAGQDAADVAAYVAAVAGR